VPVGQSFKAFTFTATPAIGESGAFFLSLYGPNNSDEVKIGLGSASPGSTSTTTTPASSGKFDLEVSVTGPGSFPGAKAGRRITIDVTVANNGPAESAELAIEGAHNHPTISTAYPHIQFVSVQSLCRIDQNATTGTEYCVVPALAPHGSKSYSFDLLWTSSAKSLWERQRKPVTLRFFGDANSYGCKQQETTCANNSAEEDIVVR
jgi:hypothetical protein